MSRSLNKVTLIGNLGNDPEVRSTTGGNRVATFSLATSRSWNDAAGSKQEKTEWHRCVVWNTKTSQLADIVEKYVKKGDKLYVEGRIEYRQWQDKENQTRYSCSAAGRVRGATPPISKAMLAQQRVLVPPRPRRQRLVQVERTSRIFRARSRTRTTTCRSDRRTCGQPDGESANALAVFSCKLSPSRGIMMSCLPPRIPVRTLS